MKIEKYMKLLKLFPYNYYNIHQYSVLYKMISNHYSQNKENKLKIEISFLNVFYFSIQKYN